MKNPKRVKLLPCPFCGGKAVLAELPPNVRHRYAVRCTSCWIQTLWSRLQAISVTYWNRRVK